MQLSAHIMFEGGVFACLEYLEAVPWAEDEEEKVTALLGQLQLESVGVAADVMKRCSALESSNSEDVLVRLLHSVTKGIYVHSAAVIEHLVFKIVHRTPFSEQFFKRVAYCLTVEVVVLMPLCLSSRNR